VQVRRTSRLALALALPLLGAAHEASPSRTVAAKPAGAYDSASVADRRLSTFDQAHPGCELWTDWRKLCARMGPGGSTTCRTDLLHHVAPSAPFCAIGLSPRDDSPDEAASRLRFCRRRGTDGFHCADYAPERPFGGERIAQMEDPDCLAWGLGEPGSVICRTDAPSGASSPPSCAAPAVRRLRMTSPFVCMAWSASAPCAAPVGGLPLSAPSPTGVSVGVLRVLRDRPVWGVYCRNSKAGDR
jgi:hypothetical protein